MTRDELRERIAAYLAEALRGAHLPDPAFCEMADRIVEIVRPTPKFEWRNNSLFSGSEEFGRYTVCGSAKVVATGNGLGGDSCIGTFRTIKEARAAVKGAARKAHWQ